MPTTDLTVLLAVLIAANVFVIVAYVVVAGLRRRRTRAAIARVAVVAREAGEVGTLTPSTIKRGTSLPGKPEADPLGREIDRLTGLLGATDWNRLIADEDVRHARYKRPATVVVIELDGIDRLVKALGQLAADRVIVAVADTVQRHARKADHVARLGTGRFGILLPETDEVAAINYVERVRQASDLWLESGAIALRLAIGWASPIGDSGVAGAQTQAIERMFGEMLRGALRERTEAQLTEPTPGLKGATAAV